MAGLRATAYRFRRTLTRPAGQLARPAEENRTPWRSGHRGNVRGKRCSLFLINHLQAAFYSNVSSVARAVPVRPQHRQPLRAPCPLLVVARRIAAYRETCTRPGAAGRRFPRSPPGGRPDEAGRCGLEPSVFMRPAVRSMTVLAAAPMCAVDRLSVQKALRAP